MDDGKTYISVAEFAEIKGVSIQAVYQRLKAGLKGYVKVEDGKKYIDVAALDVPSTKGKTKDLSKDERDEPLTLINLESKNRQTEKIAEQAAAIEKLERELEEARATIKRKDEQLAQKDEQLANINARLLSLAETQQELLRNQQILQAQAQQKPRGLFARIFLPRGRETPSKPND